MLKMSLNVILSTRMQNGAEYWTEDKETRTQVSAFPPSAM